MGVDRNRNIVDRRKVRDQAVGVPNVELRLGWSRWCILLKQTPPPGISVQRAGAQRGLTVERPRVARACVPACRQIGVARGVCHIELGGAVAVSGVVNYGRDQLYFWEKQRFELVVGEARSKRDGTTEAEFNIFDGIGTAVDTSERRTTKAGQVGALVRLIVC